MAVIGRHEALGCRPGQLSPLPFLKHARQRLRLLRQQLCATGRGVQGQEPRTERTFL